MWASTEYRRPRNGHSTAKKRGAVSGTRFRAAGRSRQAARYDTRGRTSAARASTSAWAWAGVLATVSM